MTKFKFIGETARLISGGPSLTLSGTDGRKVCVAWFDAAGRLHTASLDTRVVKMETGDESAFLDFYRFRSGEILPDWPVLVRSGERDYRWTPRGATAIYDPGAGYKVEAFAQDGTPMGRFEAPEDAAEALCALLPPDERPLFPRDGSKWVSKINNRDVVATASVKGGMVELDINGSRSSQMSVWEFWQTIKDSKMTEVVP